MSDSSTSSNASVLDIWSILNSSLFLIKMCGMQIAMQFIFVAGDTMKSAWVVGLRLINSNANSNAMQTLKTPMRTGRFNEDHAALYVSSIFLSSMDVMQGHQTSLISCHWDCYLTALQWNLKNWLIKSLRRYVCITYKRWYSNLYNIIYLATTRWWVLWPLRCITCSLHGHCCFVNALLTTSAILASMWSIRGLFV